jgi:hypothetical protein
VTGKRPTVPRISRRRTFARLDFLGAPGEFAGILDPHGRSGRSPRTKSCGRCATNCAANWSSSPAAGCSSRANAFPSATSSSFDHLLSVDALTIGFARRFATYKRAPLIFEQFENIVQLARDAQRPVQFIFAGKAHPRDDAGKTFIQKIIHLSKHSELKGHLVFIENYDIHVARQMTAAATSG